jgi:hypothetical protein
LDNPFDAPRGQNISLKIVKLVAAEEELSSDNFPMTFTSNVEDEFVWSYDLYLKMRSDRKKYEDIFTAGDQKNGFRRLPLNTPLARDAIDSLPVELRNLNPVVSIQRVTWDVGPHTDFARKSSLFFLLTDDSWETDWYEYTDHPADIYDPYGYGIRWTWPNPDFLILSESQVIKKNKWYVFDNRTYHGVRYVGKDTPTNRISILIEFQQTFEELCSVINGL